MQNGDAVKNSERLNERFSRNYLMKLMVCEVKTSFPSENV